MSRRLPPRKGEWIDRTQPIRFHLDGRDCQAFAGDTVTSAQLAAGENRLGRSFKYHRLRGPLSLANHDANVFLQSDGATNIRSDVTEPVSGDTYRAVNVWGTARADKLRFMEWLAPLLPVGFYYKALFKPKALFSMWEWIIRRMAGLGTVSTHWPDQRTPKAYAFTDVLVIGAGPTGMSAALAAARAGAQVLLVDENSRIGGSLDYQFSGDSDARGRSETLKRDIDRDARITVMTRAEASGYYKDHWVPVTTADGITKVRAKAVLSATGVFEQPAVFRGNDVPGVMLASAAQRLVTRFATRPADEAVFLVANEDGYRAALDMIAAGVTIRAIADLGQSSDRGLLAEHVRDKGVRILDQMAVYETKAAKGRLTEVTLAPLDATGACDLSMKISIMCDGLFMSVGWAPAAAHLYQAGGRLAFDENVGQFTPLHLPGGVFAAGRVNGIFNLADRITDGECAGELAAAHALDRPVPTGKRPKRAPFPASHPYPIFAHPKGKNFVDMDEDLQVADIENAAQEGFDNIELLKRYSTVGMGPSQGKHSNMNAIRILARRLGQTLDETGTTTARPFFHPVPLSHLAGRRFRPERHTPFHDFHVGHGAQLMEAGPWMRPEYYPRAGMSREQTIQAEATMVRTTVGLIDVSTLGKLEIFGADAAKLLDRIYTMRMSDLTVGMTRYALMTDEAGVIVDDGIAARLADDHFYVTTTTGTSDGSYRAIQRHILEWSLDAEVINRTGQLGALNVAGPKSRAVLAPHTDIDLSNDTFPYLAVRRGTVFGRPATLMRVGFVGELGYEIHLTASDGAEIWDGLMTAGEPHKIGPFGVEAQRLLRLEKGHIIVGQDTDGLTNPHESGMPWAVHRKKDFFVGQRSLEILEKKRSRRMHGFVIKASDSAQRPKECHLVIHKGEIAGRVTSVSMSPTLGHVIGLAYVDDGALEHSSQIDIRVDGGALVSAEITPTPFYDPDGARQSGQEAAA
jgi:sarcosine oxidase, subunit alpha